MFITFYFSFRESRYLKNNSYFFSLFLSYFFIQWFMQQIHLNKTYLQCILYFAMYNLPIINNKKVENWCSYFGGLQISNKAHLEMSNLVVFQHLNLLHISTELFYTTTRQGRPAMMFNNYRYNLYIPYYARMKADEAIKKHWRCAKWQSGHCRAGLTTINEIIVRTINRHNHWLTNIDAYMYHYVYML